MLIDNLCFLVIFPNNSSLSVVTFGGNQKLYVDFQLCGESVYLTPTLFKGQLCCDLKKLDIFFVALSREVHTTPSSLGSGVTPAVPLYSHRLSS